MLLLRQGLTGLEMGQIEEGGERQRVEWEGWRQGEPFLVARVHMSGVARTPLRHLFGGLHEAGDGEPSLLGKFSVRL